MFASFIRDRGAQLRDQLSALQVRRPLVPLGVAALITALAVVSALRLRVMTGFEALLPESRASVQELKRVAARTSGVSTLFVMLQAGDQTPTSALRQLADALVPELEKLGPPWVGHAESGVHEAARFLGPRAGLFLSKAKLESLSQDVEAHHARAVGEASGLLVSIDDAPKPAPLDVAGLRASLAIEGVDPARYPDGYYQSSDGRLVIVLVRSKVPGGDFDRGAEAIARIREVVDRLSPSSFDPQIRVAYSGDLATAVAEYQAINRDLTDVGLVGCLLIAAVVLLYYLRLRTVLCLVASIGVGVAWTFGATEVIVGSLNIATGFLFSIIAGNGINFGIIYMARYLEGRRKGLPLEEAIAAAHRETWAPTLTAGLAAAAAYGSLSATDFRGFHEFGLIGGVGMVLCWLATYWVLPALLAVAERIVPLDKPSVGPLAFLLRHTGGGAAFGRPFEFLVGRVPKAILVLGTLATLLGAVGAALWVRSDPMEYDTRNLRTDAVARADEIRLNLEGHEVTGHVGASGMAILVDRPEQVPQLKLALEARRAAAPDDLKPFEKLHALQDFVPTDQDAKIPTLLKLRRRLLSAHRAGAVSEADWKLIEPLLPPESLGAFGIADLPEGVARAFTENDGTRGRIVYISPTASASVDDARYLFRWADSYRETQLADGAVIRGSGRAVIYADMWAAVVADVPLAVLLSLGMTVAVVLVAFRSGRSSLAVVGSLLVGVCWMLGVLVLLNVKLNFLNFIALPITFGIGVDYAVNVAQRYVREGPGSALLAIRETGGAVTLCSLTTMLGYLALMRSTNQAVRSLGLAAFVGEVCCLLASVLVLPAVLVLLDRRQPQAAPPR